MDNHAERLTVGQFFKALESLQLLGPLPLEMLRRQYPAARHHHDAKNLAQEVVEADLLTRYQADVVYQGLGETLVIGPYVIVDPIGANLTGNMFKARHRESQRLVMLRVMLASTRTAADRVQRFQQEARAAVLLEHPNLARALDSGSDGNRLYIVTELVEGLDLEELIEQQGPLRVEQAVSYMGQVAEGMAYAHARGVVHRDLKPSNLTVDSHGCVRVLNLAWARFNDASYGAASEEIESLTTTGQIIGTIEFMSPEQAANARYSNDRSDIYSLGCTLHWLLIGSPPYRARTPMEQLMAHRDQPIPSLREARDDVPEALDRIFHRTVAKRPEDRYGSMKELASDLEVCLTAPKRVLAPAVPILHKAKPAAPSSEAVTPLAPAFAPQQPMQTYVPEPMQLYPVGDAAALVPQPREHESHLPRRSWSFGFLVFGFFWVVGGVLGLTLGYGVVVYLRGPAGDLFNLLPVYTEWTGQEFPMSVHPPSEQPQPVVIEEQGKGKG